jgi:hypothetical protein
MSKKIYFVCAPIFMYWPVAISKKLKELNGDIITGGFIGGPKKYHEILVNEWGILADEVVYTHDLEEQWLNTPYTEEKLHYYIQLFGHNSLNELVISDRQVGYGYLAGGSIARAKILKKIESDKNSHLNYIVGMLDYLETFLIKNKPDVIYSYAVAGAFTMAIALFSEKLKIKFAKLTHSRISDRVVIDISYKDDMTIVKSRFLNQDICFSAKAEIFAKEYLMNFRQKQTQPEYQLAQNNIYKSKTEFKNTFKLYLKSIKGKLSSKNDFFQGSYSGNVSFEQKTVKGIKEYWKKRPFYPKDNLMEKPYFFYTLHVDPEASTMVLSPYQTNQYAVIEAIAKAKPFDSILIVKEHLTMIGRRPKGFYENINALPGVYMVDPLESSFQFIKGAKAVITITGASGLEAIMLNKPAVFLGKFIYEWIEKGFVCTNDLSTLKDVLTNVDTIKPADDELLKRLLMSIYDSSFPFNSGLVYSGVSKSKVEDNPNLVASFANALHNFLKK